MDTELVTTDRKITKTKKEIDYSKFSFAEADKVKQKKDAEERNKDAMRLVRCKITCNNKNKDKYTGEIFCVRNKNIEVKKFIPFNIITHVPVILLNMIKEKKYQKFKEEKLPNGIKTVKPYLIDEYNVIELSPITSEEFNAIKQKQLAEGSANE